MKTLEKVVGRDVSRETLVRIERLTALLLAENQLHNIISKSSEPNIWERHILDSAQLLRFVPPGRSWSDVGTGPGLPGLVLAALDAGLKVMIEPRRLRVEFLLRTAADLELPNVAIVFGKASAATTGTDVITARAVATPAKLFEMTSHLRHAGTTYVLPRGRNAHSELAELRNTWQGDFGLHPSLTSDEASILVARNVRRRGNT